MGRRRANPARRFAISALHEAAHTLGSDGQVGKVTCLGTGLSRSAWAASVQPADGLERDWVALVPLNAATRQDHARFARELDLLDALCALEPPFRLPQPIGTFDVHGVPVQVVTRCGGAAYDRTRKQMLPADLMTRTIGEAAAQIHRLPTDLPTPDASYASAHAHASAALAELQAVDAPFVAEAVAWCTAQLPRPGVPARLLHGDLLGQNVLVAIDHPPAVIDWEYAKSGDPASDLAIVIRGRRKLFGDPKGGQMLFDAYDAHAEEPVHRGRVRLHELALLANHVTASEKGEPGLRDHHLRLLHALWRRTEADGVAKPSS